MDLEEHEVVVVGGGLAGLTAGLFSARSGRATVVLMREAPGGALVSVTRIEDFPGFPEGVAGFELGPLLEEQASAAGAHLRSAEAERLERAVDGWVVEAGGRQYRGRAVVLAMGTRARTVGSRQQDFTGRGVSSCASCDGPLFRDRPVAVVGGGDTGLSEALELRRYGAHITLFEQEPSLRAQQAYVDRVLADEDIRVCSGTVVEDVLGDEDRVTGVRTRRLGSGDVEDHGCDAVFVYAGREPDTAIVADLLDLDPGRRVRTDAALATGLAGLFAAGDVRAASSGQAVAAAGDGAAAAVAAHRYLSHCGPGR